MDTPAQPSPRTARPGHRSGEQRLWPSPPAKHSQQEPLRPPSKPGPSPSAGASCGQFLQSPARRAGPGRC